MIGRKIFGRIQRYSKTVCGLLGTFGGLLLIAGLYPNIFDFLTEKFFPENEPPVAKILVSQTKGAVPFKLLFDGAKSSDPENERLKFKWFVNDQDVSSKEFFRYEFDRPDEYRVILEVEDDKGRRDKDSVIIEALPGEKKNVRPAPQKVAEKVSEGAAMAPESKKKVVIKKTAESSGVSKEKDKSSPSIVTDRHVAKKREEQSETVTTKKEADGLYKMTLHAPEDSDIYIDGKFVGDSVYYGEITGGEHVFSVKKEGAEWTRKKYINVGRCGQDKDCFFNVTPDEMKGD